MRRFLKVIGWIAGVVLGFVAIFVSHANYRISHDEVDAPETHATGRFVTVQGHKLHVRTFDQTGNAQDAPRTPLMIIHGFALSGHTTFMPWAEQTLASRPLILPDMLGYGYSERLTTPGAHYELHSYSRDLLAMLDQLGVQQVDVAGHSWGGVIAAQFAHDHPERVRRLVIIDGAFFFPDSSPLEKIIDLPLGIGRAVVWHALGGGPYSFMSRVCHNQTRCETGPPTQIAGSTEALRATIHSSRSSVDIRALEHHLGQIRAPTLVLWGAFDRIVPISTGERLTKALPDARFELVEDAWHMPWLEQPQETAQKIVAFLD